MEFIPYLTKIYRENLSTINKEVSSMVAIFTHAVKEPSSFMFFSNIIISI